MTLGVAVEADGSVDADGDDGSWEAPPASVEVEPQADSATIEARARARARQVRLAFLMDDPPVDA